jgi:hypothetical protein
VILLIVVISSSIVGCTALAPAPTPTMPSTNTATATQTKTSIPMLTDTLIPEPPPTATNTPTNQELLDDLNERTQGMFHEPAGAVIDFLLEIQESVRTDNEEKLASLIHYPITIYAIENEIQIQNAAEFIANYEKIITQKWKDEVLSQEPATLFVNWQGVMVHRGEVWFAPICLDETCQHRKFYILTINTRAATLE